jgi:hypothetical protein
MGEGVACVIGGLLALAAKHAAAPGRAAATIVGYEMPYQQDSYRMVVARAMPMGPLPASSHYGAQGGCGLGSRVCGATHPAGLRRRTRAGPRVGQASRTGRRVALSAMAGFRQRASTRRLPRGVDMAGTSCSSVARGLTMPRRLFTLAREAVDGPFHRPRVHPERHRHQVRHARRRYGRMGVCAGRAPPPRRQPEHIARAPAHPGPPFGGGAIGTRQQPPDRALSLPRSVGLISRSDRCPP